MYVRWKRRKGTKTLRFEYEPRDTWSAVLVENKRINGKPSQRVVKYLGSFREEFRESNWIHLQNEFWQKITPQLDALGITGKQREQIETQIATVVYHPTPEEADHHWIEILKRRVAFGGKNATASLAELEELEARCSV